MLSCAEFSLFLSVFVCVTSLFACWWASGAMVVAVNSPSLRGNTAFELGAGSPYNLEEAALAVGEVIGYASVKSATWMNRAVVLFVKVEQVNWLGRHGWKRRVLPPSQPASKVTLSTVPSFVTDTFSCRELSRHGKIVFSD